MLSIHELAPVFEASYSYPIMFVVVITLGLIHGCLDYEIETKDKPNVSRLQFSYKYTFLMLLVAGTWLVSPFAALVFFLACTAWHFGETDFSIFKLNVHPFLIAMYGLGITGWLIGSHLDENQDIFCFLKIACPDSTDNIPNVENITTYISIGSIALITGAAFFSGLWRSVEKCLILSSMLMVTWMLPMIPAFTVYFGFWHSLHTLNLIKEDINLTFKSLIVKAAPYLLICIAITFVMIMFFSSVNLGSDVVLVVFISALTLPHATTMHNLLLRYRSK